MKPESFQEILDDLGDQEDGLADESIQAIVDRYPEYLDIEPDDKRESQRSDLMILWMSAYGLAQKGWGDEETAGHLLDLLGAVVAPADRAPAEHELQLIRAGYLTGRAEL